MRKQKEKWRRKGKEEIIRELKMYKKREVEIESSIIDWERKRERLRNTQGKQNERFKKRANWERDQYKSEAGEKKNGNIW